MGDEGGDGGPVVEHLAGERPDLLVVAVAFAGPLQAGEKGIDDARASALSDLVDEAAHLAQQPRSEVGALGVEATGQRYSLADQMGQAALPLLELAISPVAVADQPAQEGVADQIADLVTLARPDMEDRGARRQHNPQPAQAAVLFPRRLIGMDHPGLAQVAQQILDDRLAGDANLPDAAVERADRERHAEPDGQELADFGA